MFYLYRAFQEPKDAFQKGTFIQTKKSYPQIIDNNKSQVTFIQTRSRQI